MQGTWLRGSGYPFDDLDDYTRGFYQEKVKKFYIFARIIGDHMLSDSMFRSSDVVHTPNFNGSRYKFSVRYALIDEAERNPLVVGQSVNQHEQNPPVVGELSIELIKEGGNEMLYAHNFFHSENNQANYRFLQFDFNRYDTMNEIVLKRIFKDWISLPRFFYSEEDLDNRFLFMVFQIENGES